MRKFKILEHTADVGLVAYGKSLDKAFANAAYGLFSIIADLRLVREKESCKVAIEEESLEELLFEWLNHLIYLFDTEMLIFKRFEINEFDGKKIRAECFGEKYDPSRHHLRTGVKAATYHMLKVDTEKNEVQVIFDV